MSKVEDYCVTASLRDGRPFRIRALKPEDRVGLLEAVRRSSSQSLYRRFFGLKRHFSEAEITYFLDVDFLNHVALVAEVEEGGQAAIVGGARYVVQEPGQGEIAFAVIDQYQGHGLGAALMRHLVNIGREAGLKAFTAEILPDNIAMLRVFQKSGFRLHVEREPDALHVVLVLCSPET